MLTWLLGWDFQLERITFINCWELQFVGKFLLLLFIPQSKNSYWLSFQIAASTNVESSSSAAQTSTIDLSSSSSQVSGVYILFLYGMVLNYIANPYSRLLLLPLTPRAQSWAVAPPRLILQAGLPSPHQRMYLRSQFTRLSLILSRLTWRMFYIPRSLITRLPSSLIVSGLLCVQLFHEFR